MRESFRFITESTVKNCIVVGDYNFDHRKELDSVAVIDEHKMKDVVLNFHPDDAFTQYTAKKLPIKERPDKVVCYIE